MGVVCEWGCAGTRIIKTEAGVGQRVDEINVHAVNHRVGDRIDQNGHAVDIERPIVVGFFGFQTHAVLQARATAAGHGQAQTGDRGFRTPDEAFDGFFGGGGKCDHGGISWLSLMEMSANPVPFVALRKFD